MKYESKLHALVDLQNTANRIANREHERIRGILEPLIGIMVITRWNMMTREMRKVTEEIEEQLIDPQSSVSETGIRTRMNRCGPGNGREIWFRVTASFPYDERNPGEYMMRNAFAYVVTFDDGGRMNAPSEWTNLRCDYSAEELVSLKCDFDKNQRQLEELRTVLSALPFSHMEIDSGKTDKPVDPLKMTPGKAREMIRSGPDRMGHCEICYCSKKECGVPVFVDMDGEGSGSVDYCADCIQKIADGGSS